MLAGFYGDGVLPKYTDEHGITRIPYDVERALDLLRPAVFARRVLDDGKYDPCDAERIRDLVMEGYEDEEAAERHWLQAVHNRRNRPKA